MAVAKALYQLQLVDSERERRQQRLAEVEAGLGMSGDVIRAREAVAETRSVLDRDRIELRDLELEISGLNAKLKQNQQRLYSGRIRNPKELTSLQDEATALRRRRSDLEDEQLELMIAIEQMEAELAERQARLGQIEDSWQQAQAQLAAEREDLQKQLADLDEQRTAMRTSIAGGDLMLYQDLYSRLGGIAVARLRAGICQVCGVDVPTGVARSVERGEDLHFCPTCNRLLYGGP